MKHFFTFLTFILSYNAFGQGGEAANRPAPAALSFTYTMQPSCDGDAIAIDNVVKPQGSYHLHWDFGDGSTSDEQATPKHVYATGTYIITLTATNTNDEKETLTYRQQVASRHPLKASFSTIPGDAVCWQVPVSVGPSADDRKDLKYIWDMGDGSKPFSSAGEHLYTDPGNYTINFTATDMLGCTTTQTRKMQVVRITAYTTVHDTSVCLKEAMPLHAYAEVEPAGIPYTLEWTPGEHISSATASDPLFMGVGEYVFTVTANTDGPYCMATDTIAIHSYEPVTLTNVTASQTIQSGSVLQLNATGADYYAWLPKNGTISNLNVSNPVVAPVDGVTKYTVYGMSEVGCLDSASIVITTTGGSSDNIVPSAFTPNGDGLNDVFRISGNSFQRLVDFSIYDRNGRVIFKTNTIGKGWDGSYNGAPQETGVFSYHVTVIQNDGNSKTYKGNVTLIR